VDGATQVLAHMCVVDDGVWSYIRTKKYIEAAASLLRDKLTQVQACSTLVGMCSDDEELLERLIHSTSWSFVLRLLSPSSSIQAQHTALQLVLVASNREKLRASILAAIDVSTLLALLTCNEDVARTAALATFNNLCDAKSGGGIWRRVVAAGHKQLALRQLHTVLEVEVGNANERAVGFVSNAVSQIPADVSATMGPQELAKCRQIVQMLVPVVKAGEQCGIECRASALRALGRLGEFPGVSDSLVEAGTVDMVSSVIRQGVSSGQDPSFLKSSLSLLRTVLAGDSPAVSKARVSFLSSSTSHLVELLSCKRGDSLDWGLASDALAVLVAVSNDFETNEKTMTLLASGGRLMVALTQFFPLASKALSGPSKTDAMTSSMECAIELLTRVAADPESQSALLTMPGLLSNLLAVVGAGPGTTLEEKRKAATDNTKKKLLPRVVNVLRYVALATVAVDRAPTDGSTSVVEAMDVATALVDAVLQSERKSSQTFTSFSDKQTTEAVSRALEVLSLLCSSPNIAEKAIKMGIVKMSMSLGKQSGVGGVSFGISTSGRKRGDKLASAALTVVTSTLRSCPSQCAAALLEAGGIVSIAACLDAAYASGDDVRSQQCLQLLNELSQRSQRACRASAKNKRLVTVVKSLSKHNNICVKETATSCLRTLRIKIDPVKRKSSLNGMSSMMKSLPPRGGRTPPPQFSPSPSRPSPPAPRGFTSTPPRPFFPSPGYNNNNNSPAPPRRPPPQHNFGRGVPRYATSAHSPSRGRSPMYASSRPVQPPSLEIQASVKFLVESGFTLQKARIALDKAGGDQQKAMNMLLDGKI